MNYQWYVIHTLSSHEDKVKKLIEKSKEKWSNGGKVGEVKLPLLEMAELRNNKKRIVKKKLMPGYLFVELDYDEDVVYKIRNLPGVMGFVSAGNEPQVMTEEEMQSLFTEIGDVPTEEKVAPRILFSRGDIVKIIDGPFANFQGVVDGVDPEKGKLTVSVEIFNRSTPVELDYLQVGKS